MGRLIAADLSAAAIIACLCLVPIVALADDDEPAAGEVVKDPAVAKKWLAAGQQLVQKGDAATRAKKAAEAKTSYDNAITAFEKALEAGADVNVYYELAIAEDKAGKLDRATAHFRHLTKAQGAKPDLVKKATARFDDLSMKVGLVTIISKPEGATISISGNEVGKTPLAEPFVLMPGTYAITIAAPGHDKKEIELEVDAGSESERTIELPVAKTVEQPVEQPERPVEKPIASVAPSGPSKTPLYAGAAATGGFVLVATITGIMAVGKHSTFEDETASPGERADAKDAGKTLALVTDICIVGAVAAGGFTAYWYFAKYKPAQRKMETKAAVVPWVKSGAGGLALTGSF